VAPGGAGYKRKVGVVVCDTYAGQGQRYFGEIQCNEVGGVSIGGGLDSGEQWGDPISGLFLCYWKYNKKGSQFLYVGRGGRDAKWGSGKEKRRWGLNKIMKESISDTTKKGVKARK